MTGRQIKRKIEDLGYTMADVGRMIAEEFGTVTAASAEVMMHQMLSPDSDDWYPKYAPWLESRFRGVRVNRAAIKNAKVRRAA
jgi:hypothetical protein